MAQSSAAGDAPRSSTSQARKPPVISLAMLRRAIGDEIASLPVDEVSRRVYAGVLLKDDKKQGQAKDGEDQEQPYTHKYWVDKHLNKSCWMVLAKGLSITSHNWSMGNSWKEEVEHRLPWTEEEEPGFSYSGNIKLPVVQLKTSYIWYKVHVRQEIQGKCKTILLSPRTTYQVEILVKNTYESKGPIDLSLDLPDGNRVGRRVSSASLEKEKWSAIRIGIFETTPKTVGEVSFSIMLDLEVGLYVKGVVFRPTASTTREED